MADIRCAICGKPATIEGESKFGFKSCFCDDCRKFVIKETIVPLSEIEARIKEIKQIYADEEKRKLERRLKRVKPEANKFI